MRKATRAGLDRTSELLDSGMRHDRVWQARQPKENLLTVLRNFLLSGGRLFGRTPEVIAVAATHLIASRSIIKLVQLLSGLLNSKFPRGRFVFKHFADGVHGPARRTRLPAGR